MNGTIRRLVAKTESFYSKPTCYQTKDPITSTNEGYCTQKHQFSTRGTGTVFFHACCDDKQGDQPDKVEGTFGATDLVQVLKKLSKISKSKKSLRPQDALRLVNSPVQKKVPKFQHPIRAGIFEEEEHNPLETKSLSTLSHLSLLHERIGARPHPSTPPGWPHSSPDQEDFLPTRPTKRNEFMRKEKIEQVCSAVGKLLENNAHLRLLSSKSHPAGAFQDVIHAISEGKSKVIENYIDTSQTVVDACDGDQNSLLHYATAVGVWTW
ncbi:hypothetical protein EMCRGX_G008673 [Ephydatia muelleri]